MVLTSAAMFAAVLALLGERVSAGRDPVLSMVHRTAAQPVIVRRVVHRTILTTVTGGTHKGPSAESSGPVTTSQAWGASSGAAPVTRSS